MSAFKQMTHRAMDPFEQLTERIRAQWSADVDYQPLANQSVLTSELQVRATGVQWGDRVLDVAAGTGNTALAAARRGAQVTATDLSPVGLQRATLRAAAEGLALDVEVADAQHLPFDDASFDVVLSTFGVMYAPDQQQAADELLRVCRPGGRIGLVSWCPTGTMKDIQTAIAKVLPAPPFDVPSPHRWGIGSTYRELFGDRLEIISSDILTQDTCAESPRAHVESMLTHLPPWRMLFGGLEPDARKTFVDGIEIAFSRGNENQTKLFSRSDYLQVIGKVAD
jgi:SAM-dependent methyltransferase